MKLFLCLLAFMLTSCSLFETNPTLVQKIDPKINYKRDMVITLNGVTREGSITMPLLPENKIQLYSRGDMDTLIMKTCGGVFDKSASWDVQADVKSFWGNKKITLKKQAQIIIKASDFAETGVCPVYFYAVSKADGKVSTGYINFQTDAYKLDGSIVCNMERRAFEGVEACSIGTGSFMKLYFTEEVMLSPEPGCELDKTKGSNFEFQAPSGVCNYVFKGTKSNNKGFLHIFGEDDTIIR